jgi:hypothetical protein
MQTIRDGGTGVGAGGTQAALATRNALRTITANQTRALAAGDQLRSAVTWVVANGRRYSGGLLIGATVITSALSWFYDEAQRSTGTPLDDYWNSAGPAGQPPFLWDDDGQPSPHHVIVSNAAAWWSWTTANFGEPLAPSYSCTTSGFSVRYTPQVRRQNNTNYASGTMVTWGNTANLCMDNAYEVDARAAAEAYIASILALGDRPPLTDYLAQNPAAVDGLRDVLRQHADEAAPEISDPHTFSQPFPDLDVTFEPNLSWSTWMQSPYADRDTDTDGDGWPDWIEQRLGTNPYDPASRPLAYADPDGDGRTNQQELADLTDPLDADDYDAGTTPEADPTADPQREDLLALLSAIQALEASLAGVSTEDRQVDQLQVAAEQLAELQAIADTLTDTDGNEPPAIVIPDVEAMLGDLPELQLTPPQPPEFVAADEVGDRWDPLVEAMSDRAPFAYLEVLPDPGTPQLGGSCPSFQVGLFGQSQTWDLCDNPLDDWMQTSGRSMLLNFSLFFFLIGVVRRVVTT